MGGIDVCVVCPAGRTHCMRIECIAASGEQFKLVVDAVCIALSCSECHVIRCVAWTSGQQPCTRTLQGTHTGLKVWCKAFASAGTDVEALNTALAAKDLDIAKASEAMNVCETKVTEVG